MSGAITQCITITLRVLFFTLRACQTLRSWCESPSARLRKSTSVERQVEVGDSRAFVPIPRGLMGALLDYNRTDCDRQAIARIEIVTPDRHLVAEDPEPGRDN